MTKQHPPQISRTEGDRLFDQLYARAAQGLGPQELKAGNRCPRCMVKAREAVLDAIRGIDPKAEGAKQQAEAIAHRTALALRIGKVYPNFDQDLTCTACGYVHTKWSQYRV